MKLNDGISAIGTGTQSLRDARTVASSARSTVNETANAVNEFNKRAGRDTQQLGKVFATGNIAKGLGVAGIAASVVNFAMAAKNHDLAGMINSLSNMAQSMQGSLAAFEKMPGAADLLKRIGGPVAIVAGITGAIGTLKDMQKNGPDPGKLMKLSSNVLTSVAGAAMMIPGGQVVAGAAGAAAAALQLGALAYQYRGDIAKGAKWAANELSTGAKAIAHGATSLVSGAESLVSKEAHKTLGWLGL